MFNKKETVPVVREEQGPTQGKKTHGTFIQLYSALALIDINISQALIIIKKIKL